MLSDFLPSVLILMEVGRKGFSGELQDGRAEDMAGKGIPSINVLGLETCGNLPF